MIYNKVTLGPSYTLINNYKMGDCPSLENKFKLYDEVTCSTYYLGLQYDDKFGQLVLPRGLDISYIMNIVNRYNSTEDIWTYNRLRFHNFDKINNPIRLKYPPRDNRQRTALEFMTCNGKYEPLHDKSQFSVNLPTGAGKTYCGIATIAYLGIKTVIITAQTGILEQWKSSFRNHSDINNDDMYTLTSGSINRILYGSNSNYLNKSIYFVTHSTLKSYGDSNGWDKIDELFKVLKIGIKIYDEAHQNFNNMIDIDYHTNVYRTYYLTATPGRSDTNENKIYKLYMQNIPFISLFDNVLDPHTKYIALRYNSFPTPFDLSKCRNKYGLNHMAYIDYLMNNRYFWIMFDYIFDMVEKAGGKALFYIGKNSAIELVMNRIITLYPEYRNDIGIYTSISDNKKDAKEKRFILTTTKSAGAGEDIVGLKFSIVLAEPFKSEILAKQTLGRTRDRYTYYIELVDVGFRQIVKYYNTKKPIFNKYALDPKQNSISKDQMYSIQNQAFESRLWRSHRLIKTNVQDEPIPLIHTVNNEPVDIITKLL